MASAINLAVESHSLLELMQRHRTCQASDPRDKVYGLLGIAGVNRSPIADMSLVPKGTIPRLIKVDYKIGVEEVYTRAARSIMARDAGRLTILQLREDNDFRLIKSLPSWIPDFSTGQLPARLGMAVGFSASGSFKWEAPPAEESDAQATLLPAKGVYMGDISGQTPSRPDIKEFYKCAAQVASALPRLYVVDSGM
jgi:hypothetical protein